jgi:thiol-disulfide isomerase/thioredoxin
MKKTALILVTLAALFTATYWADRHWAASVKSAPKSAAAAAATPAPDVSIKDLDGRDVRLADYRGKVVLVNFWATWCEPCRIEIPWMIEFQQKYGARGFTVLGVAMDEEGKTVVQPFVTKQKFDVDGQQLAMNYPILLGNDDIADKFGGLIGLPTSILITRDGKKVKTIIGLVNHDDIAKAIEGLL